MIEFDGNGSPRAASNSTTAAIDIVSNSDLAACPGNCFRPVGLAWDAQGRLFMSSDSTGEIYVITKADGSGIDDVSRAPGGALGGTPTGGAPSPSTIAGSAVGRWKMSYWVAGAAIVGAFLSMA
jgi:hypothetical protein